MAERSAWGAVSVLAVSLVACRGQDVEDGDAVVPVVIPDGCAPLEAAEGSLVRASPGDDLPSLLADATPGTTVLLADGTYDLSGGDAVGTLRWSADHVRLRGESGDPSRVVLDARADTDTLVSILGDGALVADLTLTRSFGSGVDIRGAQGTTLYRVILEDAGEHAILAAPADGRGADGGVARCIVERRVGGCGTGVALRQTDGWTIAESEFDHGSCDQPAIRAWSGARGTRVERNVIRARDVAMRIGDVSYDEGEERVYPDAACDGGMIGHYGGIVRDNLVVGALRVENVCGTRLSHNTVWNGTLSWSFADGLALVNNLADTQDGGGAARNDGGRAPQASDFVDPDGGDLHLAAGAAARGAGVALEAGFDDVDVDGDPRDRAAPAVGADEP
ncbi:MAG: hypothetical protein RLZZ299_1968 [Pseudomonadota bacterium]